MGNKRKEQEQKILAQMEEAVKEEKTKTEGKDARSKSSKFAELFKDKTPEQIHCRKCNTLMENGKCPSCGHSIYVPMDATKQMKIRLIVGAIGVAIFLLVFALTR